SGCQSVCVCSTCSTSTPLYLVYDDPAAYAIQTLSLHDALPISEGDHESFAEAVGQRAPQHHRQDEPEGGRLAAPPALGLVLTMVDRKSTRLNSSHGKSSYAVFCLEKKRETVPECGPQSGVDVRL